MDASFLPPLFLSCYEQRRKTESAKLTDILTPCAHHVIAAWAFPFTLHDFHHAPRIGPIAAHIARKRIRKIASYRAQRTRSSCSLYLPASCPQVTHLTALFISSPSKHIQRPVPYLSFAVDLPLDSLPTEEVKFHIVPWRSSLCELHSWSSA